MTPEQTALLQKARDSLRGAKLLATNGLYDFAASRAYYVMFYVAEALLLGQGLSFSTHAAAIAAFGQRFAGFDHGVGHKMKVLGSYRIRAVAFSPSSAGTCLWP